MANLTINGKSFTVDVEPDTPLLWAIRENVGLTGTKYGCGIAQCGACTVHIDGVATRSCGVSVSEAAGKQITTIEGLASNGALHKVQQAWIENDVPQCGYCQSGVIMAVAALLKDKPKPTDQDIDDAITNICRCGTFKQVREAIHASANEPPHLRDRHRRGRNRPCARPRYSLWRTDRGPRRRRLARDQRLGRDPA
jgi:isoquinoline 1-oxidoreductase subunit alpha